MTNLKRRALASVPFTEETVEKIYAGMVGEPDIEHIVGSLCVSHERLRAELNGAQRLLETSSDKQLIDWVCVGCGAKFKHIPHDETVQYCTPCVTVQAQADLIDQLRTNIKFLHAATIVGRNALSHNDLTARAKAYEEMTRLVDLVRN